jgi:hypothetical protein
MIAICTKRLAEKFNFLPNEFPNSWINQPVAEISWHTLWAFSKSKTSETNSICWV